MLDLHLWRVHKRSDDQILFGNLRMHDLVILVDVSILM